MLKYQIKIVNRASGQVVSTLSAREFVDRVGGIKDAFIPGLVEVYNDRGGEDRAVFELLSLKAGKWVVSK